MSETPQERIAKWLGYLDADEAAGMEIVIETEVREAIRAVLDLVRVQYEANEEMTRLLAESRLEWPEVAAANLVRAEKAEAALRELHWLGQNWPRYWVVGPLRRDTRPPSEAVKALRDTAPREEKP